MKTFNKYIAQGDLLIIKVDSIPEGYNKSKSSGPHIVAHSETGHNHIIDNVATDLYQSANDPMIMYLAVNSEADLIHLRSFDTHETISFTPGLYEIRRQREYTPEGWRRVED